MSESTVEVMPPDSRTVAESKPGFLRQILGQFLTADFWRDFAAKLVQEGVFAFFRALGQTFQWYGETRRDKQIAQSGHQQVNTQKAFGGGSYQPSSYPVSNYPAGDSRYHGFGPR